MGRRLRLFIKAFVFYDGKGFADPKRRQLLFFLVLFSGLFIYTILGALPPRNNNFIT